jgi:uncharacterized membrane protein HdeD (DUF308 family)
MIKAIKMDFNSKPSHPLIQLFKAYLGFFFFAGFFFFVSVVSSHQPGDQAPYLVVAYSLIVAPILGGFFSIFLSFKQKEKQKRFLMLVVSLVHIVLIYRIFTLGVF